MNIRAIAASIVYQVVVDGCSLSDCLAEKLKSIPDPRDKSFLQALCYGTCRWYHRLDAIAKFLLDKPLKIKDQDVHCLILVGLYQLAEMRVAEHAAVAETVAATRSLKKPWAKNLVNAVLRQYQRQHEKIELNEDALYSHPAWFIKKIQRDWPKEWETILNENNQHPPFALRVNQKHVTRDDYIKKLAEKNPIAHPIAETKSGIFLEEAVDVKTLPGFLNGDISVQDGAAQLAAELLLLEPGQRVLDACAAPGGKTTHIAETVSNIELIAIDRDAERVKTVKENCERLKLSVTCLTGDAADTSAWWDNRLFDRILLDAPCSASGVIRRHPDIKLLRRETDIAKLAEEQTRLLKALWNALKPDGILVYATCSVFSEENTRIIEAFLAEHGDAKEEKILADWGKACSAGRQILTGSHSMDGFYYARLRKRG